MSSFPAATEDKMNGNMNIVFVVMFIVTALVMTYIHNPYRQQRFEEYMRARSHVVHPHVELREIENDEDEGSLLQGEHIARNGHK
ncbi:unnamed protein product [Caenorhabditis auriculariae]|uniref:Uncharacterized protein n=1 Tax=Caenorhabditis auriculariae TaxID=2777116 RepID=A0A8S1GP35_9PELO|nr:unnamed protein product [Caenorhabditis auriculariae]